MAGNSKEVVKSVDRNSTTAYDNSDQKCPICLSEIEDLTVALDCRHVFCFDCISRWISQRNRCPVCRQLIHHIRHKVRNPNGVEQDQDVGIPASVAANNEAYIINFDFFTLVQTPLDSPLFVVQPVIFPLTSLIRYSIQLLESDHIYYLTNVRPGTLFVMPENLSEVVQILEASGISRYEPNIHMDSVKQHATFLNLHYNHNH